MIDEETSISVKHLMPKSEALNSVEDIPLEDDTIIMAKADGEFTVVYYDSKQCYAVNQYGRMRRDFPAINELCGAIGKLMEAVFLCELYAVEDDKPLTVNKFLSMAKGKNALPEALRLGVFDLLTTNGEPVTEEYGWKMDEVSNWLKGCHYCHVLPYIRPQIKEQMVDFWKHYVEEVGFEGVMVRSKGKIWKIKPTADVDAVIIGLNKRSLFDQEKITSFKTALMDEEGGLLELTDVASGINHDLRSTLWRLMKYKTHEDNSTVYIKPMIVCTIEYQETFIEDHKGDPVLKRRWTYADGKYTSEEKRSFVSLRFPRLVRFRGDKEVNPQDLRVTQLPGVLK